MFANEQRYGRIPFYNTVQLLKGSSQIYGEYRKMILVPMGEYLPYEEFLSGEYSKDFLRDVRRYAPGRELSVIAISPELSVGTPICLEALHSNHVGEMVKLGAQILINPSNDGYFGRSPGAQFIEHSWYITDDQETARSESITQAFMTIQLMSA